MRNLKRALSLALASVMLMGMMVVGTSAASFPDVDDEDNIEAIDVLETVEVMIGNENGDFEPDKDVTRAEMAVVMAKLLNYDYNYYVTSCPFDDVPDWAKGYVGACAANGIVSGRGEGVYDPNATVTAVEAASMMMRALGYFQNSGDYSPNFESATVRQASAIGLFSGINGNARDPMNRNQVAKLALNTLEARMVSFTGDMGFELPGVEGTVGYRSEYTYRTGSERKYNAIAEDGNKSSVGIEGQYYVQLGEQLYDGDLKKTGASDDFDRPATKWTYKTNEIGVYANDPDFAYTTAAEGDTPADKVKSMDLKGLTWDGVYYENGHRSTIGGADSAARLENLAANIAADGVLIEIFMDGSQANTIGTVTVIRSQVMQIASVNAKQVTLKTLGDNKRAAENQNPIPMGLNKSGFYSVKAVKEDDYGFDVMKDLKVDDYVLVVPVEDGSSYKVGEVSVPESITGRLTNIQTKSGDYKVKSITVDGETYGMSYSWTAAGDDLAYNTKLTDKKDATIYFDSYGYAIYVKDITASNGAIIVKQTYNGLVDGKLVTYVQGWDIDGEEITLNLGTGSLGYYTGFGTNSAVLHTIADSNDVKGTVWEYTSFNSNDAEYALVARGSAVDNNHKGDALVFAPAEDDSNPTGQWIKNGQFHADVMARSNANSYAGGAVANRTIPMATDVKFIFLSSDNGIGTNVTGLTIRNGVTAVGLDGTTTDVYDSTNDRLEQISYVLNGDKDKVVAVVVSTDGDAAVTENLIFVETANEHWMDPDDGNKIKTTFKAYDANGELMDDGASKLNKDLNTIALSGKFFTYSQNGDIYSLTEYTRTGRTTSVATDVTISAISDNGYFTDTVANLQLNARDAKVVDLDTSDGIIINNAADMARAIKEGDAAGFKVAYIYNGNSGNQGYLNVSTMFVLRTTAVSTYNLPATPGVQYKVGDGDFGTVGAAATARSGQTVQIKIASTTDTVVLTPVTSITNKGNGVFEFTMPANHITKVEIKSASEYAGLTEVNLGTPGTVVILYDKAKTAPTGPQALELVMQAIEKSGKKIGTPSVSGTAWTIPAGTDIRGTFVKEVDYTFNTASGIKPASVLTVDKEQRLLQDTDTLDKLIGYSKATDGTYFVDAAKESPAVSDFIVATGGSSNTGADLAGKSLTSGYFKVTENAALATGVTGDGVKVTGNVTTDITGAKAFVKKTDKVTVVITPDAGTNTIAAGSTKIADVTVTGATPVIKGDFTANATTEVSGAKATITSGSTTGQGVTGTLTLELSTFTDDVDITIA